MPKLLNRIKSKLYIASFRKAVGILEGEYLALSRGRSLDFDDLRDYVPGQDTIRDIDWRATARISKPLVKQYISTKQQPLTFIVDTGRSMEALSLSGHHKKEIVIEIIALLGYLTNKHHDPISMIYGNDDGVKLIPLKEGENHLEQILQTIQTSISIRSEISDIYKPITYASQVMKRRGITVIITSDFPITKELTALIKKLQITQEVLWITVKDGDPLHEPESNVVIEDVETFELIPEFIRSNIKLHAWFHQQEDARSETNSGYMKQNQVGYSEIGDPNNVIPTLMKTLEVRRREQQHKQYR